MCRCWRKDLDAEKGPWSSRRTPGPLETTSKNRVAKVNWNIQIEPVGKGGLPPLTFPTEKSGDEIG